MKVKKKPFVNFYFREIILISLSLVPELFIYFLFYFVFIYFYFTKSEPRRGGGGRREGVVGGAQ